MAVTSVSQAVNTVNSGIGSLASNYETFLHLLTTQLKNQDPLSPLDNNQFTQQLTAMTGVQQQLLTNQLLTQLVSQDQDGFNTGAVNLIGKQATASTSSAALSDGKANWGYNLPAQAASTVVEVLDSSGRAVLTQSGDTAKGDHVFTWNGKNTSGQSLADGTYSLRVTALDADGKSISVSTSRTGLVSGVEVQDGQSIVTIGGVKVPLASVTRVEAATS